MFNLTIEIAHTFYVGGQGWLVHNQSGANKLEACIINLGKYKKGDKTQGAVEINGELVHIISGRQGPGYEMFKNIPGAPIPNLTINTHVEAHVAALMHQNNIKEAVLYINNMPCTGALGGCMDYLKYMIPEGSRLKVIIPKGINDNAIGGWEKTFTGVKPND